jgi:glycosyltransferase involved in cell wall biosynthesis/SAM-dependent methyltransferase
VTNAPTPLRVLVFGTYDRELHPRITNLERALQSAGCVISELQEDAWPGKTTDKLALARNPASLRMLARFVRAWLALGRHYRTAPEHDVVLVGYFGHLDVLLARMLAGRRRVVLDMMLSVYDTVVLDRKTVSRTSVRARVARLVDRAAVASCRVALLDTPEQVAFVSRELGISRQRLVAVPVSADPAVFAYQPPTPHTDRLKVLFFGTFVPLQGTGTVAEACGLLRDDPVDILVVGQGERRAAFDALVKQRPGVEVRDWVSYETLGRLIADHHVALGVFGTSGKAARVVPNKAYQAAAVGRCLVTADTPAARRAFAEDAVLVAPNDPAALADAIRRLAHDPQRVVALGEAAHRRFQALWAPETFGPTLAALMAPPQPAWTPPPRFILRRALVRRLLDDADSSAVTVEIGFGSGGMLEELARRGFRRVIGVETSPSAAAVATSRLARVAGGVQPELRVGGAETLTGLDGQAALVLAFEVLEQIEHDAAFVATLPGLLAPGGRLVVSVPAHADAFSHVDEIAGHFRRYDRDPLCRLVASAGLRVEQAWCYGFPAANLLDAARRRVTPRRQATSADGLRERSQTSGNVVPARRLVRLLVNDTTMQPFVWLQQPFLSRDAGPGYLLVARRD